MIKIGSSENHLFGRGVIDIYPHLEKVLQGMAWCNEKLYNYRTAIPYNLNVTNQIDDIEMIFQYEIPNDLMEQGDNNDNDDDDDDEDINNEGACYNVNTKKSKFDDMVAVLQHHTHIDTYTLVCLAELFEPNYVEVCATNPSNCDHIQKLKEFKDGHTKIEQFIQDKIHQVCQNKIFTDSLIVKVRSAEVFITEMVHTLEAMCTICSDKINTDGTPTGFKQKFKKDSDSFEQITTCKTCSKLIESIFLANNMEREVKSIANDFVIKQEKQSTNNEKTAAVFNNRYFKTMVQKKITSILQELKQLLDEATSL